MYILNPYRYSSFDPDYQAVLNRATALGFTKPSSAQQVIQNTLMIALKAATSGGLSDWDYFRVTANDGSDDFACINWANPNTFLASLVNNPTWTSNQGFTGATTTYVDNNFVPSTDGVNLTQDDFSMLQWYFSITATVGVYNMGSFDSVTVGARLGMLIHAGGNLRPETNAAASFNLQAAPVADMNHAQRTSSTAVELFQSGASADTGSITSIALPDDSVFSTDRSDGAGMPANLFTDYYIAFEGIGRSFSAAEALAIRNAFNTYITSI